MAELNPRGCWNPERDGTLNEDWIKVYIFFKTRNRAEYEEYRKEILLSVRTIVRNLEELQILESFHFCGQPFPQSFDLNPLYFFAVLDVRIWIKGTDHGIEKAKQIIREELSKQDYIADFGFWYFRKDQPNYCKDFDSRIYYDIVCRIYELFCRLLFEKLDAHSSKNLNPNGFSDVKLIHHVLNSQGMGFFEEAFFGILYAHSRLRALEQLPGISLESARSRLVEALEMLASHEKVEYDSTHPIEDMENRYLYFPLHVEKGEGGTLQVHGQWGSTSTDTE